MTRRHPLSLPGIYRITCKVHGKVYVGQAKKVSQRWQLHRSDLRRGKHKNGPLQADYDLYGEAAFEWELVAEPLPRWTPTDLTHLEIQVMEAYPFRYNLMIPVQVYLVASEATRERLSQIHKSHWANPEFVAKQKASRAAMRADPQYKANHQAAMRAFWDSPEGHESRVAAGTKAWAGEEIRERQGKRAKAVWEDPAHREKQHEIRKAVWEDPDKRARRTAGLQSVWDRYTPEEKAARQAKMRAGRNQNAEERSAIVNKAWEVRRERAAKGLPPLKVRKDRKPKESKSDLFDPEAWWNERLGPES